MRKFILLVCSMIVAIITNAQDIRMGNNATYVGFTGAAGDTLRSTTTTVSKSIHINKSYLYYYSIIVDIDTLQGGGNTAVTVALTGSEDNTNYYSITSQTWGATADTIIRFHNLSSSESHSTTVAAYNEIRRGTATTASYYEVWDTASANGDSTTIGEQTVTFADTVAVGAQTITTTNTISLPGVMWRYLKVTCTGSGANARAELQAIETKIVKIP